MDDKQKKAERWDVLTRGGMAPEEAAAQVEREFGPQGRPAGVRSPGQITMENMAERVGSPLEEAGKAVVGGVRTAIGAVPFGSRMLAFGRSLDKGLSYKDALAEQRGDVEAFSAENPKAAMGLSVAANLPLITTFPTQIAGSTLKAGAAAGGGLAAASRLGAPTEESAVDRMLGTIGAGAGGAAVGAVAPWLLSNPVARTVTGGVVGGMMAPEGRRLEGVAGGVGAAAIAPWLIEKAGANIPGVSAVREAMGSRGAVNKEMEGVQRVLSPFKVNVGESPEIGQKVNEFSKKFYDQSDKFFAKAHADKQLWGDPQIQAMLRDPDIAPLMQAVRDIRAAQGNPLPSNLIDPSGLHLLKRLAAEKASPTRAAQGVAQLENVLRIEPKVDLIRKTLHGRSADFRMADEFHTLGKTAEEGVEVGYGAVKPGQRNPSAANIGETDVAGALKFIERKPVGRVRDVAEGAVRRGAQAQVAQQLSAKDLQGGRQGLLASPILDLAGPQAEQRALALGPDAAMFEDMLKSLRVETARDANKTGILQHFGAYLRARQGPVAINVHGKATPPLDTPEAQGLLSDIVRDPKAYQKTLKKYLRGKGLLDLLSLGASGSAGASVGR